MDCLGQNAAASTLAEQLFPVLVDAGALAVSLQADAEIHTKKFDRDFATDADIAVQEFLVSELNRTFPRVPLVGEEDTSHDLSHKEYIVVDPIDGTFLYSAGSDAWGITLAYFKNAEPYCGFLYQPARQRMIYAERNQGCFLNGARRRFQPGKRLSESIIALVQGCWNSEEELLALNIPLSKAALFALTPGSAVDAGFELISGVAAAYLNYHGKVWDFAALALAVEEAGGMVSSPKGTPRRWNTLEAPCLFAATQEIHAEVLGHIPLEFRVE